MIIVITLSVVAEAPLYQQILTLTLIVIALAMTVGVYGLFAGIVRLDDAGFALVKSKAQGMWGRAVRKFGQVLVSTAPFLMKALSWIGTIAMFLVGGKFVAEGILPLEHAVGAVVAQSGGWGAVVKVWLGWCGRGGGWICNCSSGQWLFMGSQNCIPLIKYVLRYSSLQLIRYVNRWRKRRVRERSKFSLGGGCYPLARWPGRSKNLVEVDVIPHDVHFFAVHMDKSWVDQPIDFKGLTCIHVHLPFDWHRGGILVHGIEPLHHAIEAFSEGRGGALTGALLNGGAGVIAGAVVLAVVSVAGKLWRAVRPAN